MVKRKTLILLLFVASIFLSGCCCQNPSGAKSEEIAVSINNYNITRDEFEQEFKDSANGKIDTPESRKDFLNSLIDRKLILQYAQAEELDKKKSFLKMIEKFWEQSLLKIALDKKTKEIEAKLTAPTWAEKRTEETKMISDWMNELRNKAHITVKDDILKSKTGR